MPRELRGTRRFELSPKDVFDLVNSGLDDGEEGFEKFDPLTHIISLADTDAYGNLVLEIEHMGAVEVQAIPSPPSPDEQDEHEQED